jgi:adenosylcobyric acid synthase
VTEGLDCSRPSAVVDGAADGAVSADGRIVGTYLHGLFSGDAYRSRLLQSFGLQGERRNYGESVDRALDAVAAELEAHLDGDWLNRLLG